MDTLKIPVLTCRQTFYTNARSPAFTLARDEEPEHYLVAALKQYPYFYE